MADASDSLGKGLLLSVFLAATFVVVASFVYVLLMGYGFVFFTADGIAISSRTFLAYILLFFWVGFYIPIEAGAAFLIVWIVYILCFVAAWRWRESFHSAVRRAVTKSFSSVYSNFLLILPLLSSMLLFVVSNIIYLQESAGIPTGETQFPQSLPLQGVFLELAYVPVIEEFGFRIIPIGLYTVLYVFLGSKVVAASGRLLITAPFNPDEAKRAAGLRNVAEHGIWRGISAGEWVMIIVTSALFGYAHVISGIGWQVGKITSVFVQAFFFGVTYLAYGFEAPILLHWYFNYFLFFFDPSVVLKFFPGANPLLSVIELVVSGPPQLPISLSPLGILGWAVFSYIGLGRLLKRRKTKHQATPTVTTSS